MSDVPETLRRALADRYAIERELGQGGMATVYLAEDLRHHRKVALKVLRPEIAATLGAGRFAREIEVAARLQHPNILPLLDSGEAAGFFFYVMPYVEGESLRDRLARGGELPIPDAVRILMEVADALSHAHAHGVVHRDIKPDNVMLSGRHALVTDFGVAKAVTAATGYQALTATGVALGTPTYMAPEQATADPHQDHRVDIYALGVLAYELLTGRAPYAATTAQEMLAAHVTAAPEPLETYRPTVSPALAQIIMKCLAKKPADRWQTADELLQQLEPLATPSGGTTPGQTAPFPGLVPRRRVLVAGAVGAALVLAAVGVLASQLLRSRPLTITVSDVTQVTSTPGAEFQPALSPDGMEVAYLAGSIRAPHLVIRSTTNVAGGGEVRLSDTSLQGAWYPAWSSGGDLVRLMGCSANLRCSWFETGRLGGVVRPALLPVRARNRRGLAWSPDGRVVFGVSDTIFVAALADTAPPRRVAVQPRRLHSFAWAPDGKLVAYVSGNEEGWWNFGRVAGSSIWVVSPDGGAPQPVTDGEHLNLSPAWLDARHLLFVSNRDGARGVYVVEVGPRGARGTARILPGIADPHSISYSIASHELAWSKFTHRQNIWSYPLGGRAPVSARDGVRVTTGNEVSEYADVSPDGRWLAFTSNRRGNMELYKQPLGGGAAIPLTDAPWDEWGPRWSPDGSEIAFFADVRRSGGPATSIAIMPSAGGQPTMLTNAPGYNGRPVWSPDGRHIAFNSDRQGQNQVWILSRDQVGTPWHHEVPLSDSGVWVHDGMPDGSGFLCWTDRGYGVLSLQGRVGPQRNRGDVITPGFARVSRDGRTLYSLGSDRGRMGLWAVPISGGASRLVVAEDSAMVFLESTFGVTRDRVYLAVSEYESDIWVAKLRY